MGHLVLWCGTCSAEDHRDSTFYEPPHDTGHRPLSGWATRPNALASDTTARATVRAAGWERFRLRHGYADDLLGHVRATVAPSLATVT